MKPGISAIRSITFATFLLVFSDPALALNDKKRGCVPDRTPSAEPGVKTEFGDNTKTTIKQTFTSEPRSPGVYDSEMSCENKTELTTDVWTYALKDDCTWEPRAYYSSRKKTKKSWWAPNFSLNHRRTSVIGSGEVENFTTRTNYRYDSVNPYQKTTFSNKKLFHADDPYFYSAHADGSSYKSESIKETPEADDRNTIDSISFRFTNNAEFQRGDCSGVEGGRWIIEQCNPEFFRFLSKWTIEDDIEMRDNFVCSYAKLKDFVERTPFDAMFREFSPHYGPMPLPESFFGFSLSR